MSQPDEASAQPSRPPFAPVVWLLATIKLALHLATASSYGWHSDELYYRACTQHLGWGFVDHPPLSIAMLAAWNAIGGDSMLWTRLPAALAGTLALLGTALIARELGGRAWAQALAALVVLAAPVFLVMHSYASMNAYDTAIWTLAMWLSLRIAAKPTARSWLALGLVIGLGILNKWTVAWLAAGLLIGFVASRHRRLLASRYPWLATALAAVIVAPHLWWQMQHGWPTLAFIQGLNNSQLQSVWPLGPVKLIAEQALVMNPVAAPLWLIGLWVLLRDGERPGARVLAIVFIVVVAILTINGASKAYYLSVAAPPLIAAGAVWAVNKAESLRRGRLHLISYLVTLAIMGAVLLPLALRLLPPEHLVRYQAIVNPAETHSQQRRLDEHFSLYFGWPQLVDAVAKVHAELPDSERDKALIFTPTYAEASAIEHFGGGRGLPPVICGHSSYWLWGPPDHDPAVVIIVGGYGLEAEIFEPGWADIQQAGRSQCDWCSPMRNDRPIWLARGMKAPLRDMWSALKHFD